MHARVERQGFNTVRRETYTLRWITPWFRMHSAQEDYECDHCGDKIRAGDEYDRRVGVMTCRKGRQYWHVERHHVVPECKW